MTHLFAKTLINKEPMWLMPLTEVIADPVSQPFVYETRILMGMLKWANRQPIRFGPTQERWGYVDAGFLYRHSDRTIPVMMIEIRPQNMLEGDTLLFEPYTITGELDLRKYSL